MLSNCYKNDGFLEGMNNSSRGSIFLKTIFRNVWIFTSVVDWKKSILISIIVSCNELLYFRHGLLMVIIRNYVIVLMYYYLSYCFFNV